MRMNRRTHSTVSLMACRFAVILFLIGSMTGFASMSAGQALQQSDTEQRVSFSRQVLPILSDKCFVCHGPDTPDPEYTLRLDSVEAATADRGGYSAVNQRDVEDSELLIRIHDADNPMPPADAEKQLTERERELLSQWIREGGNYEQHWAFVRPERDPTIDREALQQSDAIDWFVGVKLEAEGADFAPAADPSTLARRAALILTGLPPESEPLASFLSDPSPQAYENYVDQLLASSRFGEHQARYWLDAVRYGDTHGLHLDNRRGIYPYRDWVVKAFNDNLPFDSFIEWQLAGDLFPEPTLEQLVATGFVRLNPSTAEGGAIPAEFQAKNNFDRVETLGTVLLGMTMTCARCHTHKYDPITQQEYYELFAFFNSTAENAMDGNAYEYGPVIRVPADYAAWRSRAALLAEQTALIATAEEALLASSASISLEGWNQLSRDDRWAAIRDPSSEFATTEIQGRAIDWQRRYEELAESYTTSLVTRQLDAPRVTQVLRRGDYGSPVGESLTPGVPNAMNATGGDEPQTRLELAQWLTSPDQPLVARVVVNRIWQRTFGEALVRTPEDFGLQGEQPTHPELLDWLALDFQESGWNVKAMLKRMVLSQTFQQSSAWRSDIDDPENRLFARGPSFRMDAEMIRDLGLWSSDLLDPTMGGEGVKPYQPSGMWKAMAHPGSNTKEYVADTGQRLYRRSLYVYWKRTSPHPMMTLFDAPDRETSCVRRSRTNTALQSLALLNETQRVEMARVLAENLLRDFANDELRLDNLIKKLTCREPTDLERTACMQLLSQMQSRFSQSPEDAELLLAIGESTRDDSIDPVACAAWTQVVTTILASDMAILVY